MLVIGIISFLIWAYVVWVLDRAKLKFFKYAVGTVGAFVFMLWWIEDLIVLPLMKLVAMVSGFIGEIIGMFDSYYRYCMIFIPKQTASISLYVDFECSGVIEMMAFTSLVMFYELYTYRERIKLIIVGILYIFASNVLRILVICFILYFCGNNWFYFAHAIFGRLVFYALTIILYFNVFTKPHIKRQRVGQFTYEKEEPHE